MRKGLALQLSVLTLGALLLTSLIVIDQNDRKAAALSIQMLYYPLVEEPIESSLWSGLSADYQDSVPSILRVITAAARFKNVADSVEGKWSTPVIRQMYLLQAGGALESYATHSGISISEQHRLWASSKEYFEAYGQLRIPDMFYKGRSFPIDFESARNYNKAYQNLFPETGVIRIEGNEYRLDRLTQFQLAFVVNYLRYAAARIERSYAARPLAVMDTIMNLKIKDYRSL